MFLCGSNNIFQLLYYRYISLWVLFKLSCSTHTASLLWKWNAEMLVGWYETSAQTTCQYGYACISVVVIMSQFSTTLQICMLCKFYGIINNTLFYFKSYNCCNLIWLYWISQVLWLETNKKILHNSFTLFCCTYISTIFMHICRRYNIQFIVIMDGSSAEFSMFNINCYQPAAVMWFRAIYSCLY